MRLLRNREVRRELLLLTGITAALCAVGWAMAGPCCAGLLLVSGAASAAVYLVSARRRYRALADMSQDIDRVLHGLDSQTIAACDEGELAILSSEIRKMTVRLRQAADSQHRERMQLMTSQKAACFCMPLLIRRSSCFSGRGKASRSL